MGESGIGKSTLLNLIAGLERPDGGSIVGRRRRSCRARRRRADALRRERMGFVFQAFHVLPYLTVAQNVALPLALLGVRATRRRRARRGHARCGGPGRRAAPACRANCPAANCSASPSRARSSIVRRSCSPTNRPATSTRESAASVMALLRGQLKAQGATGMLVTHSRAAAAAADRVLMLCRDGLRETPRATWPMTRGRGSTSRPSRATLGGALGRNRGRLLLSVLAIALGVALGFAVQLINEAAIGEFAGGMAALSGDADLEVRGPRAGFDENALRASSRATRTSRSRARSSKSTRASRAATTRCRSSASTRFARARSRRRWWATPPIRSTCCARTRLFLTPAAAAWLGVPDGRHGDGAVRPARCGADGARARCSRPCAQRYAVMDIAAAQERSARAGA